MAARKRAPGGGRKPLDPDRAQSAKVMVRLKPDLQKALEDLAEQNKRDLSKEIRDALYYWLLRSGRPALHIGSLTSLVEVLVAEIERHSKKRWVDDVVTGVAVCEEVEFLIRSLAPKPTKSVTVPPNLRIAGAVLALADLAKHLHLEQQSLRKEWRSPEAKAFVVRSSAGEPIATVDGPVLRRIMEDLGSGLGRSQPPRRHK